MRDIAARLRNVDVNLSDGDRIRDARSIDWFLDDLENSRSDHEDEQ
jgi:hypothetical protein